MKMTAAEIAAACGGTILCGNPQTVVTSFFTDSRETCPDGFFVPIKGERTDAHVFIDATLQAGAAGSFTQGPGTRRDDRVLIRVDDTLRALQDTAKA